MFWADALLMPLFHSWRTKGSIIHSISMWNKAACVNFHCTLDALSALSTVADWGCLRGRGDTNKRGTTCIWGGGGTSSHFLHWKETLEGTFFSIWRHLVSLDVGEFDVFSLHIFHSMPLLFLQWYHTFFLSLRPHRGESSAVAGVCACVCVC